MNLVTKNVGINLSNKIDNYTLKYSHFKVKSDNCYKKTSSPSTPITNNHKVTKSTSNKHKAKFHLLNS